MQNLPWMNLVWTDYRLAVLLTVILPIALLIWAIVHKTEPISRLMLIYWRVASLFLITVYLFIGAYPLGFLSGWAARILIPLSLWFWIDLNEEIVELPKTPLKVTFMSWRWAVSIFCIISAIGQIPALRCAFLPSQTVVGDAFCQTWLFAPWMFRTLFHSGMRPYTLGLLGAIGLGFYILCFGYFVFVRLGKQGRSATVR